MSSLPPSTNIPPPGPLAYEGQVALPYIRKTFSPTNSNTQFNVPTLWVNTSTLEAYLLVSKALGTATWAPIGGTQVQIDQITTPDTNVVTPVLGNINFANGAGMNITGSGDTVTFSLAGGSIAVDTFTTNVAGPVVPDATGDVLVNASTSTYTDGSVLNTLKIEVQGTNHSLLLGTGTNSPMTSLGVATDGQLPIGSTGADPVLATLTAGSGIGITNAAGSITISADNAGMNWQVVTTDQTGTDNTGYIVDTAGNVNVALPATSSIGDTFEVNSIGAGTFTITQAAGQQVVVGSLTTTLGAAGTIVGTGIGNWIQLTCYQANNLWIASVKQGSVVVS